MSKRYSSDRCPVLQSAIVDDEGFCSSHGWDCDDYELHLVDQVETNNKESEDLP